MTRKGFDSKKLLQELKDGNKAAHEYFYKQCYKVARKYVKRLIGDLHNADIIYSQVFKDLITEIGRFSRIEDAKDFLIDAIEKACVQFVRDRDGETTVTKSTHSGDQNGKKNGTDDWLKIQDIIGSFPRNHRFVFELSYFHELRNKDVARLMDIKHWEVTRYRMDCFRWLMEAFDKQDNYRQFFWLLLQSNCFRKDAGYDTV